MGSPGGHVQESAHAFSFLGGLFGVRQRVWDTCSKYFYSGAIHFPPQATPTILLVEAFSSLSKWSHFDLLLKKRSHVGCCPEKSLKKLKKIEKM